MITAFVLARVEPASLDLVAQSIADGVANSEVFSVAGGDADLIAIVRVESPEALKELVTRHLATIPGIRETRTSIAYREYSTTEMTTAYDVFGE